MPRDVPACLREAAIEVRAHQRQPRIALRDAAGTQWMERGKRVCSAAAAIAAAIRARSVERAATSRPAASAPLRRAGLSTGDQALRVGAVSGPLTVRATREHVGVAGPSAARLARDTRGTGGSGSGTSGRSPDRTASGHVWQVAWLQVWHVACPQV